MIDGSEKRNRQLAFEPQNSHVCEKRSKITLVCGGRVSTFSLPRNHFGHYKHAQWVLVFKISRE